MSKEKFFNPKSKPEKENFVAQLYISNQQVFCFFLRIFVSLVFFSLSLIEDIFHPKESAYLLYLHR